MARNFTLNTKAAMEANNGGKRIREAGKYIGTIRSAWYEQSPKGAELMALQFVADNGQEADMLTIYTHKANGEELSGYNLVNAIMTCCRKRDITTKPGAVEVYDYDSKAVVSKTKDVYTELTGAKIGLVLKFEEYENRNFDIKERLVIHAAFEAATGLTADEMLRKETDPKNLQRIVDFIAKNPVKLLKKSSGNQAPAASSAGRFDDDIPGEW